MAKYKVVEITNKKIWDTFVLSQKPKSFLQSWNWGETNYLTGKKIYRLGFFDKKRLVGVCLIIIERAKRGSHLIIPGGPLIDWKNRALVKQFLRSIKEIALKEKCWFVRIRPELLDTPENINLVKGYGLKEAPTHLHAENTWVLNINRKDDELLSGMRKNTRYLIKKSFKENLRMQITINPNSSKILKKLQDETVKRHGFVGFSEKLFSAQLATFAKDAQAAMFICKKGKRDLVSAIIIFYGDYAYYHHSGSNLLSRKYNASYFTQWEVIKEAKKRGCKYYNFWGIAPDDNSNHRFSGVTTFKRGFGGERVNWVTAHDLVISKKYYSTYIFEKIRSKTRRL